MIRGVLAASFAGVVALTAPVALLGGSLPGGALSPAAVADVPVPMLDLYQAAAATCPGLGWPVLAGIGKVESDHGRHVAVSSAGAVGPMQFLPATFAAYAVDGDRDGDTDINDPADAIFTAATLLCADGAGDPDRLATAIYAYNHAVAYVATVLAWALVYGTPSLAPATAAGLARSLLDDPRLTLTANARADLAVGVVDVRVVAVLTLLLQRHTLAVSVFKTGHSEYVHGTSRISNHYYGRAADIYSIDGQLVRPAALPAATVVDELAALTGVLAPDEVGSPFDRPQPGFFTNADHQDHVHIGFR